mmetsp:Transcript_98977/g.144782  ORF Transcript_98977/g.144782 Transcript_98977/m.144782 type:complete len:205 (+) Transcript_98977:411-1025(+)
MLFHSVFVVSCFVRAHRVGIPNFLGNGLDSLIIEVCIVAVEVGACMRTCKMVGEFLLQVVHTLLVAALSLHVLLVLVVRLLCLALGIVHNLVLLFVLGKVVALLQLQRCQPALCSQDAVLHSVSLALLGLLILLLSRIRLHHCVHNRVHLAVGGRNQRSLLEARILGLLGRCGLRCSSLARRSTDRRRPLPLQIFECRLCRCRN